VRKTIETPVVICPHIAATLNNSLKSALPGHLAWAFLFGQHRSRFTHTTRGSPHHMLHSPRSTTAHNMLMCMMTTAAIERPGSRSRAV
jgi:hypothetical protein